MDDTEKTMQDGHDLALKMSQWLQGQDDVQLSVAVLALAEVVAATLHDTPSIYAMMFHAKVEESLRRLTGVP